MTALALLVAALISQDAVVIPADAYATIYRGAERMLAIEETAPIVEIGPWEVQEDDQGRVAGAETLPVRIEWVDLWWRGVAPVTLAVKRNVWWGTGIGIYAGTLASRHTAWGMDYGVDYQALTLGDAALFFGAGRGGVHVAGGYRVFRRTYLKVGPALDWRGRPGAHIGIRLEF